MAQTRSVRSCPPTAAVDLLPGQAFEDSVRPQVLRRMQVLRTNNFRSEPLRTQSEPFRTPHAHVDVCIRSVTAGVVCYTQGVS